MPPARETPRTSVTQFSLRWLVYLMALVSVVTFWIVWIQSEHGKIELNWWWFGIGAAVWVGGFLRRWLGPPTVGLEWMVAGSLIAAFAGFDAKFADLIAIPCSSSGGPILPLEEDFRARILLCALPSVVTFCEGLYGLLCRRFSFGDAVLTGCVLCIVADVLFSMHLDRFTIFFIWPFSHGDLMAYSAHWYSY